MELLESISNSLSDNQVVLLSSSAGSGKTSILQLFKKWTHMPCRYVSSMYDDKTCAGALIRCGIDLHAKTTTIVSPICIMLDNAELTCSDTAGWFQFLQESALWLPPSIKLIISGNHTLPGLFKSIPTFNRQHLLVSDVDANWFLGSEIGLRSDMQFKSLKQVIIHQCGGLIGALRMSVDALTNALLSSHPSETECLLSYLSNDTVNKMVRNFHYDSFAVADSFRSFLKSCFVSGPTTSTNLGTDDTVGLFHLQKAGILVEVGGRIGFSSVLSQRYVSPLIFPQRSNIPPASLHILLKSCIQDFSRRVLAQSVVDGFLSEHTFQVLLMEGLAKFTTPECPIYPEFSKVFPSRNQEDGHEGEIDIFLNGSLRWGIEIHLKGYGSGKHIDKFGKRGKYSILSVNDYALVDFRFSHDGEPTNVRHHEKRVSVFFKTGDFSQCKCIFGFEPTATLLTLAV